MRTVERKTAYFVAPWTAYIETPQGSKISTTKPHNYENLGATLSKHFTGKNVAFYRLSRKYFIYRMRQKNSNPLDFFS